MEKSVEQKKWINGKMFKWKNQLNLKNWLNEKIN